MTSGAVSGAAPQVVPLTEEHAEQAERLGVLAFGGDPAGAPPPSEVAPRRDAWCVLDRRGRLVARAVLLDAALAGPAPVLMDDF